MIGEMSKFNYWLEKILWELFVVFVVTTITFFLMHHVPGDPYTASIENLTPESRDQYIADNCLDKPIWNQYVIFLKKILLKRDLGTSMINKTRTVTDIFKSSLWTSIKLGVFSVIIAVVIGYIIGTISSYINNIFVKTIISLLFISGISLPVFVWAPFLQSRLGCNLGLFPISGWGTAKHYILPILCLLPNTLVTTMKYTKNSIEEIRKKEYYITNKQRGIGEWQIFRKHIFKNTLPSIITIIVSNLSGIFSGAFIVEKIFSIPGIGREFMNAISMRDYTILIGLNIVFTVVYVFFRLLGDLAQECCNPKFSEE